MIWEAWFTLGIVVFSASLLIFTRYAPDLILVGGLTLLLAAGILSPAEALEGVSNPGLATVGVLYLVVAGLIETGTTRMIGEWFLGRPRSVVSAQIRLMLPVAALSAFLNNTPVVAMMVPAVEEWAKRQRLAVSKLMIPLSYASIFGGTCTLIGTSTNLIINGLAVTEAHLPPMGFFTIAWVGLPCTVLGILFILGASHWLLADRHAPISDQENPREYAVEMLIEPTSPIVGKTIEEAGLRHLPGAYLAEIERDGDIMPAVGPTERLYGNDRLLFVGIVASVVDLVKTKGLVPAPDQLFRLDTPRPKRCLIEAVVSDRCPLVGKTIRDGRFRSRYEAVVIAVARNGERVSGKIGDITLRTGDTLLLEAWPSFVEHHRNDRDFLLISAVEGSNPLRHERSGIAVLILGAMVAVVALGIMPMLTAAFLAAGLMILCRCTSAEQARRSLDWSVLTVIAASFGIGKALQTTGVADTVAHFWIDMAGSNPWLGLIAIYAITSVFTAFVTNNAAAVLVFPIAMSTAANLGVNVQPFVVAMMVAASASFATPVGYQTNLMVYGPGGYRFEDYVRIGLPLNILLGITTILIVPTVWPF